MRFFAEPFLAVPFFAVRFFAVRFLAEPCRAVPLFAPPLFAVPFFPCPLLVWRFAVFGGTDSAADRVFERAPLAAGADWLAAEPP
jgi:hypothetical protein